jgi:hypothetical protein
VLEHELENMTCKERDGLHSGTIVCFDVRHHQSARQFMGAGQGEDIVQSITASYPKLSSRLLAVARAIISGKVETAIPTIRLTI